MQIIKPVLGILIFSVFILTGCKTVKMKESPKPAFYKVIDSVLLDNGYPKDSQPWIVFSDQNTNKTAVKPKPESWTYPINQLDFLSPLIVLKKKKDYLQVAEYKDGIIKNGRRPRKKELNVMGWVAKDNVLLWNSSLKSTPTLFSTKAALVINNIAVMEKPEKYIEKDSILIYDSPELKNVIAKVGIGSLMYIYKQSTDKHAFLLGKQQSFTIENSKDCIYGWVSKHVVSIYGDRPAIKINQPSDETILQIFNDTVSNKIQLADRTTIENVYPIPLH